MFCLTHHIEWFIPVNANTHLIYFHANDISLKNEMSEHHKNSTFTKCDQLNWLCFFPQIKLNVWWDWDAALCRDYLQHSKYHLSVEPNRVDIYLKDTSCTIHTDSSNVIKIVPLNNNIGCSKTISMHRYEFNRFESLKPILQLMKRNPFEKCDKIN